MGNAVDRILEAALALPAHKRALLAARLAESLEATPAPGMQALWLEESAHRVEAWRRGDIASLSEEEAMIILTSGS